MFHVFLLCSGCAAFVNLAVGYFLYAQAGFDGVFSYPVSVAIAFVSGMGVSYLLNRRFTYPPSGRSRRDEMLDFLFVSLFGLLITTSLAQLFRVQIGSWITPDLPAGLTAESLAHIGAVGLTALYSFFAHKLISFRKWSSDHEANEDFSREAAQ